MGEVQIADTRAMKQLSGSTCNNQTRILVHSQRQLSPNFNFLLGLYEFEGIIQQIDRVDIISPEATRWFPYGTRLANRLAITYHVAINPGIQKIKVQRCYDLFFAVACFPRDLRYLNYVKGWRDRCKLAICWLNEIWVNDIANNMHYLRILKKFDYVIVQTQGSVTRVQEIIGIPCVYMPVGIDTVLFCPYPTPPRRVIDVYSLGRRSEKTHSALLRLAKENGIFYVYDTMFKNRSEVHSPNEHRLLLANMTKRSRYFIVNPGKADTPEETQGQVEFGSRFFEGAASGAIMVGETPRNEQFAKVFDWTDAVVHLPFESEKIDRVIYELDKDHQRQHMIRRNNIVQSLLHHDWVYRWEDILKIAGLQPMPELLERKQRLANLATMAEESSQDS